MPQPTEGFSDILLLLAQSPPLAHAAVPAGCVRLQYFAGHTARICCTAHSAVCFLLDGHPGISAEEEGKAGTAVLLAFVLLLHEFGPAPRIAQISEGSPTSHLEANASSNTA